MPAGYSSGYSGVLKLYLVAAFRSLIAGTTLSSHLNPRAPNLPNGILPKAEENVDESWLPRSDVDAGYVIVVDSDTDTERGGTVDDDGGTVDDDGGTVDDDGGTVDDDGGTVDDDGGTVDDDGGTVDDDGGTVDDDDFPSDTVVDADAVAVATVSVDVDPGTVSVVDGDKVFVGVVEN